MSSTGSSKDVRSVHRHGVATADPEAVREIAATAIARQESRPYAALGSESLRGVSARSGVDQAVTNGESNQVRERVGAYLAHDIGAMSLGRLYGYVQLSGDFLIVLTFCQ